MLRKREAKVSAVGGAAGQEAMFIRVSACGLSDVGRVRKNNEDNFAICDLTAGELSLSCLPENFLLGPRGVLLVVADGMGGQACGEVASRMCVDAVRKRLYENLSSLRGLAGSTGNPPPEPGAKDAAALLGESIEFANRAILKRAQHSPAHRGMGTTATAVLLIGQQLFVAQVGDSRAYLIRNRQMAQLTRDQTFLNFLADMGADPPLDPENDPRKSILTQAVGTSETLDVKLAGAKVRHGDTILLCSDGLYNMIKAPDLLAFVNGEDPLAEKCKSLVEAANMQDGSDNITVVIANLNGPGLSPAEPGEGVAVEKL